MSKIIETRREIVLLVDYTNCNPQGDLDRDNRSRTDPVTSHGLITAVGFKRKIRDQLVLQGHRIYIGRGDCLETNNRELAVKAGVPGIFGVAKSEAKKGPKVTDPKVTSEDSGKVYKTLGSEFIDVRLFGGLVPKCSGTFKGPVQLSMGLSVDEVTPTRMAITRVAVATEAEAEEQAGANRGIGGLWYIPYGMYRVHIIVSPNIAKRTGCTEEDYDAFLKALVNMFDDDHSSVRMGCVRWVGEFRHNTAEAGPGAMSAGHLLESIKVVRSGLHPDMPPRSFEDYTVLVPEEVETSEDFVFRSLVATPKWTYPAAVAAE